MKKAFKINNANDYGLLMAFCIEHDVSVFRTYFNVGEVYNIDFNDKRCYHSKEKYYIDNGYTILVPDFYFDKYDKDHRIKPK